MPNPATSRTPLTANEPITEVRAVDNTKTAFSSFEPSTDQSPDGIITRVNNLVDLCFVAEADTTDRTGDALIWLCKLESQGIIPMYALELALTFGATVTGTGGLITNGVTRPAYGMAVSSSWPSGFNRYGVIPPVARENNAVNKQLAHFTFDPMGFTPVVDLKVGTGITRLACLASTH
ncbi:MAG: hypothetical protein ACPGVG_19885 [Mycobacterium sp.]